MTSWSWFHHEGGHESSPDRGDGPAAESGLFHLTDPHDTTR
jgi:hypothetical protein